jgi:precorrin-6Y C5,15-methyltransferase (decarboxylating)
MHQVHIVGLGVDHKDLAPGIINRIESAEVLMGGDRLLHRFPDHPGVKISIKSPLEGVIQRVKEEMQSGRKVVVLADGDPLFFGIGKRLIHDLGREKVTLHPNITTLQAAAARMKTPWHNMEIVSLHGRKDLLPLLTVLAKSDRVAVYTDPDFHPAGLADDLLGRGIDGFGMYVFEDLGMKSERVGRFVLKDAAKTAFSQLNFVMLERTKPPEIPLSLGLDDDLYRHHKGLITKKEIRAVGISALALEPNHTVWDLGAGCGSVAIEASLLAHEGAVLAVEKNEARVQLIRDNISRMGAYGVQAILGEMPQCLASLPEPDRIFMGGGMGEDDRVLEIAARRLKPGGRLVLHLVLMGSLSRTRDYLQSLKWPFTVTQVAVSRSHSLAGDQRLAALNPVFIVTADKR